MGDTEMKKLIGLLILSVCGTAIADVGWPPEVLKIWPSQPTTNAQVYISILVFGGSCSSIQSVSVSGLTIRVSAGTYNGGGACPFYGGPWQGTLMMGPFPPGSHNIYADLTEERTYGGTRYEHTLLTTITVAQSYGSLQVTILPAEAVAEGAQWRRVGKTDWLGSADWLNSGQIESGVPAISWDVEFKPTEHWRPPEPIQVSVLPNEPTRIQATYAAPGSLQVTILPAEAIAAGAQWRRVGTSVWLDSGQIETVLAVPWDVEFKPTEHWRPPEPIQVSILPNKLTPIEGIYAAPGSLKVTIQPTDAVAAGAKWRRVGTTQWMDSGQVESPVLAVPWTVELTPIANWIRPEPVQVSITPDQLTEVNKTYAPAGSLQVTILPAEAVAEGAQWRRVGTWTWLESGQVEKPVLAVPWAVEFKPTEHWKPPEPIQVSILQGEMSQIEATYAAPGSLQVTILPAEAIAAGAQWRCVGTSVWLDSGQVQTVLAVPWVVEFKPTEHWRPPEPIQVSILPNEPTQIEATYAAPGSLQVTILPAEAIAAGAQWRRVGTTEWLDSGQIEIVLAVPWNVEFKPTEHWRPPDPIQLSILPNELSQIEAAYAAAGSLQVTILPAEAVTAGAQWRRIGTTEWLDSGQIETSVLAVAWTIEFKPIAGWRGPARVRVSISPTELTQIEQTYPHIGVGGTIVGWGDTRIDSGIFLRRDNIAVAAGREHSLALRADSTIAGWGNNSYGQATPPTGNDFIAIAAGEWHSLALRANGSIVGWGDNWYGEANSPMGYYVAIATSWRHNLALRADGSIVGWGSNEYGQATPPAGNNFIAIAAGLWHSIALRTDGSIVGWGMDDCGQATPPEGNDFVAIAVGSDYGLALRADGSIVGWGSNEYGQATAPAGNDFVAIAAGGYFSLAMRADGSIVGWGSDELGQATPPEGYDFVAIAAGYCHSLAVRADGSMVGWGNNYDGGDNYNGKATPPTGDDFVAIVAHSGWSSSFSNILALRADGSISAWGRNNSGQATPPAGKDFVAIAAGGEHGIALRADGSIVGWGSNEYGQATPPAGNDFVAIAAGSSHNLALRADGSIKGWGDNYYGEAKSPDGNGFVSIAAGVEYSLALRSDGAIVGWGWNDYGQATPPAGNNFVAIAAGFWYSLALRADGSIVGWGDNSNGQATPLAGKYFAAIAADQTHSLALRTDGSIACWGDNYFGQVTPPGGNDYMVIAGCWRNSLAIKMANRQACGDFDRDADVDLDDLTALASYWLGTKPKFDIAPSPRRDGIVNMLDLAILAENWLSGISQVGGWGFDGNWSDSIGQHNGTAVGDPDWVTIDQAKKGSGAAQFDGDDMVRMEGYKGILGSQARTCTAWIKTTATVAPILYWGKKDALGGMWDMRVSGTGRLRLLAGGGALVESVSTVNSGQWTHVAVVLPSWGNSVNDVLLYVNGIRQARSAIAQRWINTVAGADFRIGADDTGKFFIGLIDDVRIYDRALTPEEIAALASQ
jgi:alpha-tubulin suppressor-like RCC1 family protein